MANDENLFILKVTIEEFYELFPTRKNVFSSLNESNEIIEQFIQLIPKNFIVCDGCNKDISRDEFIYLLMVNKGYCYGTRCLDCISEYYNELEILRFTDLIFQVKI